MKDKLLFAIVIVIRFMYAIRDIIALVAMIFVAVPQSSGDGTFIIVCGSLVIALFLSAIRWASEWESLYVRKEFYKHNGRFTSTDSNGNPIIRVEDIPEIIEFLYALEEEELNGRK